MSLKRSTERILGQKLGRSEFRTARKAAENKLQMIIRLYGDADGARRSEEYLAELIADAAKAQKFSDFTLKLSRNERKCDRIYGKKKSSPIKTNNSPNKAYCTAFSVRNQAQ